MDKLVVPYRLRVRQNIVTLVKRTLPSGKGEIFVSSGQEVAPVDILGEGVVTAGYHNINLAQEMEVGSHQATKTLQRQIGQTIFQGELLASKKNLLGFQKKNFFSPVDGILDLYDSQRGILRLKLIPKRSKLVSGVFGIVQEVDKTAGKIIIKSSVTIIYGVLGTGKEREGNLKIIASPEILISSKQITSSLKDQILVGGGMIFYDALEKAISCQVGGIITGGINTRDYKLLGGGKEQILQKNWSDVGISLLITEGFGFVPIGQDIFSVLKLYDNHYVVIDGNLSRLILPSYDQNCMINIRKTILPPQYQLDNKPQLGETELAVGAKVRTIGASLGVQGIVEEIDQSLTLLPSGLKTVMVTVSSTHQKVRVPLENLEIIG